MMQQHSPIIPKMRLMNLLNRRVLIPKRDSVTSSSVT